MAKLKIGRFDEQTYLRLIRGDIQGLRASLSRAALGALSLGYGLAVRLWDWGYEWGWLRSEVAPLPVVSVGNLTVGGTGKTPLVEWVARFYRQRGWRVVILSRGYGRTRDLQDSTTYQLNDEGLVLEENLPDVPHLQGRDRLALARLAVEELESQVAVLDDGFQHRRLGRLLDLVVVDALNPFGYHRLLPRGLLREPLTALRRADVFVVSRADLVTDSEFQQIETTLRRFAGQYHMIFRTRHAPQDLTTFDGRGTVEPLGLAVGPRVAAFCGIGNPEGFRRTLDALGVVWADQPSEALRRYPDHHAYSRSDVEDLGRWARDLGAELVLTTQKDQVKLRVPELAGRPLKALRIGLEFLDDPGPLMSRLDQLVPGVDLQTQSDVTPEQERLICPPTPLPP